MIKPVSKVSPTSAAQKETKEADILDLSGNATPRFGEKLARNMALAGMLLLTVTAVRNAQLPSGQTVLTAVQELVDQNWDERLGKISFVSALFPESMAVFLEAPVNERLVAPCLGPITHAWTAQEPYIGYQSADQQVYAVAEGQVMSIAHGMEEECILRLRHSNGLESMYYNLAAVQVQEGDTVTTASCLGTTVGQQAIVEVRRAGRAIDPTVLMTSRQISKP